MPKKRWRRDQPVAVEAADPVVVAVLHVRRGPSSISAPRSSISCAQLGVAAAVADVPLAGGDDLERLVALLVEVRHPLGRLRLAVEVAGLAQQRDDRLAGARTRSCPASSLVRRRGRLVRQPLRASRASIRPSRPMTVRTGRSQLAPPGDVGEVAEGAAHRDAGALVRLGQRVRQHRDLDAEDRRGDRRAEQRLVALVVGVRDQRDHGRDQLGTGGLDVDRRRRRAGGTRPGGRRRRTPGPRARPGRPRSGR